MVIKNPEAPGMCHFENRCKDKHSVLTAHLPSERGVADAVGLRQG